jgi:hypothetical protein
MGKKGPGREHMHQSNEGGQCGWSSEQEWEASHGCPRCRRAKDLQRKVGQVRNDHMHIIRPIRSLNREYSGERKSWCQSPKLRLY